MALLLSMAPRTEGPAASRISAGGFDHRRSCLLLAVMQGPMAPPTEDDQVVLFIASSSRMGLPVMHFEEAVATASLRLAAVPGSLEGQPPQPRRQRPSASAIAIFDHTVASDRFQQSGRHGRLAAIRHDPPSIFRSLLQNHDQIRRARILLHAPLPPLRAGDSRSRKPFQYRRFLRDDTAPKPVFQQAAPSRHTFRIEHQGHVVLLLRGRLRFHDPGTQEHGPWTKPTMVCRRARGTGRLKAGICRDVGRVRRPLRRLSDVPGFANIVRTNGRRLANRISECLTRQCPRQIDPGLLLSRFDAGADLSRFAPRQRPFGEGPGHQGVLGQPFGDEEEFLGLAHGETRMGMGVLRDRPISQQPMDPVGPDAVEVVDRSDEARFQSLDRDQEIVVQRTLGRSESVDDGSRFAA